MRGLLCFVAVVLAGGLGLSLPALGLEHAVEVTASDLLDDPEGWNERRVVVRGELVGDYSPRREGVWVQLNDDPFVGSPIGNGGIPETTNAGIAALLPSDVFARIEGPPGRYGRTGPVVSMEGTFLHADPARQGETYLAVESATTITPARAHPAPGPDMWLAVGVVLIGLAGLLLEMGRRGRSGPSASVPGRPRRT